MSETHVVLIGGLGFVGRCLSTLLRQSSKWHVSIADRVGSAVHCDVRDYDDVMSAVEGNDWVINLAAEHQDNVRPVSKYYAVNVDGARNICAACRDRDIHQQVFISSVAVYGDIHGGAATEDLPHCPVNDYGRSKSQAEEIYRSWWQEDHSRTLIIVRPTVIFGEGNRGNLYNLMHSIASNRFRMVGNGETVKAIAYVENVSHFILHAIGTATPGEHIFNYADKPDMTTAQIVYAIRQELGLANQRLSTLPYPVAILIGVVCDVFSGVTSIKLPVSAQRVRKFCTPSPIDTTRVLSSGFEAPIPVVDALRRTVRAEFAK